ncbi:hypothetical protein D3C86_1097370 [compost metagenome]
MAGQANTVYCTFIVFPSIENLMSLVSSSIFKTADTLSNLDTEPLKVVMFLGVDS